MSSILNPYTTVRNHENYNFEGVPDGNNVYAQKISGATQTCYIPKCSGKLREASSINRKILLCINYEKMSF